MKICFLSPYPPQPGGVPVHTSGLVGNLAKRHGISVITYGRMGRKGKEGVEIKEIPVINVKFFRGLSFFIGALLMLLVLNMRKRIDIVHAQYMLPLGAVALAFRKISRNKPKVVITAHGSDLLSLGEGWLMRRIVSWIGNSCDKLVCVSKHLGARAVDLGIKPGKIRVIYNGVDDSAMPKRSREWLRKELRLPAKKKVVTFVGSLNEAKGADIFVVLAGHLLEREGRELKEPGLLFVLVGSGSDRDWLAGFCRDNGIEDSVIFAGPLSHAESLKYIKSSDVLVIPSRVEGFGMTALEGMRLGVPVAASGTGALPEILSRISVTDNLPKTVRDILRSSICRGKIVRENKRLSEKFGLERMADETEKLYRNVKRFA